MFGAHQALLHAPALVRFVAGLTGLHVAVLPAPSSGRAWDLRRLIAGCRAHSPRPRGARRDSRCHSCARAHLHKALATPRLGHDFEGRCGVRSFLLPVTGADGPVGLLTLRRAPEEGPRPERAMDQRGHGRGALFRRAVKLLRPMAREMAWNANGHAAGVAHGFRAPAPAGRAARGMNVSASHACEARSRLVVRALIKRVQCEFARPLAIKHLAREHGLNPSYLSTVFAREAGLPFKSYLTAQRLERAQRLLCDPRMRISRVACDVGYATPRRFRAAFRAWTGLSPGRWRASRLVGRES